VKAQFAIAAVVLSAFEFSLCLWGSILTCATGRCCKDYPPSYVRVSFHWHFLFSITGLLLLLQLSVFL